jgi:drug/metabolite transporter (DMT)-like permease
MTNQSTNISLAAIAIVAACFMLAGMDAIGKYLQQSLPVLQVVWARFFSHFSLFVLVAVFIHKPRNVFRPRRPGLQILRSVLLMSVTLLHYAAISQISLADSSAVQFSAPVLVTLLAGLFLKEIIQWYKWMAVLLGFSGVLVLIRPGSDHFHPAILLSLLSSFSLAGYFILTRYLKDHDRESTTIYMTPVAGAVLLSFIVAGVWVRPSLEQTLMLSSLGMLGAAGHYLLTFAFHRADASQVSPLLYAQIVASAIYSASFFADHLEVSFYIGSALVIFAGVLVSHGSRLRKG